MPGEDLTSRQINGEAVVELGYLPQTSSAGLIKLTAQQALVSSATLTDVINRPAQSELTIRTKTPDYIDKLLKGLMVTGNPRIAIRLGIVSGSSRVYLPWQNHSVVNYHAIPYQDGHVFKMVTNDGLYAIQQIQRIRSKRGKISEIVRSMAQNNGVEFLIEETSDEESLYIQSYQDDVEFITTRLLPRAINRSGRGNYRFFVQDNVWHFHTPDYQAAIRNLSYFAPSSSIELKMLDRSQEMTLSGAAGVDITSFDPYTGKSAVFSNDPTKTLNHSKVTPSFPQERRMPIGRHMGVNRDQELKAIAQNQYERAYGSLYRMELTIARQLWIRLNDLMNISIQPSGSVQSPWSGLYTVVQIAHVVDSGALTTKVLLERGEQAAIGVNNRIAEDLRISSRDNFAQGTKISQTVVDASKVTRSAGERTASGQVVKPITQLT